MASFGYHASGQAYNGYGVGADFQDPTVFLNSQNQHGSRRQSIQSMSQASTISFVEPATPAASTPSHLTDCHYLHTDDVFWSPPSTTNFSPSANWSYTGEQHSYSSPNNAWLHARPVTSAASSKMNWLTRSAPEHCTLSQELLPTYQDCSLSRSLPLVQTLGSSEPGWAGQSSLPSSASSSICFDDQAPHSQESSQSSSDGSAETYNESDMVYASYQFGLDHGIDPGAVLSSSSMVFSHEYLHHDQKLSLGHLHSQWDANAHMPVQNPRSSTTVPPSQTQRSSRNRRSSKIKARGCPPGTTSRVFRESAHPCIEPGCEARFARAEHLKRHEISIHREGKAEKRYKCALAFGGGEFTCTINNKTNSRKNPNTGGTERTVGIPRRDNHYQHYQTHLKHKDGKTRNAIVSKDFLYFCILKHNPNGFANIKMRLEKAIASPKWPGFAEPNQEWMRGHADYQHWLDVLAGGDPLPEASDSASEPEVENEVSAVSSCSEDDIFAGCTPIMSKI